MPSSEMQHAWAAGVAHVVKPQHKLSEFETLIQSLGLDENNIEQLAASSEVRQFCADKAQYRYIPEALLHHLGIRVSDDLSAPAPVLCQEAA